MTDRNKSYLLSGELARLSGVSPDTIRFYERKGLLQKPERSANGYRRFSAESVTRVKLIRSALAVGFTISELGRILRVRNQGGRPCQDVQRMAVQKLQEIETAIHQLKRLKKNLQLCVQEWEQMLQSVNDDRPALLLQRLAEKDLGRNFPLIPAGLKKRSPRRD
jgi:MerR family transcriptional regulator, copper efflux regulator